MQRYSYLPSFFTLSLLVFLPFFSSFTLPKDTNCRLYVPNVFSPNGDGTNDVFLPQTNSECPLVAYELFIFDRWGGILFQTTDINNGWDGEFDGQKMEAGTYAYNIEYAFAATDTTVQALLKQGELILVR